MAQSTQQNPPPPPPGPPPPDALSWPPNAVTGVRDMAPPPGRRADIMAGLWVTSFTGWQLFDPLPEPGGDTQAVFEQRVSRLPPLVGGSGWTPPRPYDPAKPGSYYPREGYFLCSALVRVALDGYGGLNGVMEFIRGGRGYRRRSLKGSYTLQAAADLPGTYEGTLTESHESDNPGALTTFTYAFVLRDWDEFNWIWKEGSYRPMVASGVFKRIRPFC